MKRKRLVGALMVIVALIIMQLPVSEADAATSSASDFKMEGSTLVKYRGTEKNVSVPNTVEVIAQEAFEGNDNIELVVLPNSVKRIEAYSFWGCDNLDTVVLGKGLTEVSDYAFAGCKGLEQMTIPSNVTSIGIQAFGDCVNLKDISIPTETSSIHESAFDGCYQLTIHCDAGSTADIFARAFYERQQEMPEYEDVPNYTPSEEIKEPNEDVEATATPEPVSTPVPSTVDGQILGVTTIVGNQAVVFVDAETLNVYDAQSYVPQQQQPAADYSVGRLESGIPKFTIVDRSVVADQAFYRNEELETMALPNGIREIGQFSFARSALKQIELPQGIDTICYGAFYHCDVLETLELPDTVMLVEPKAFDHTAWVENFKNGNTGDGDFLVSGGVLVAYRGTARSVTVPEGVRVIAAEAFQGHNEINSVVMPDSLRVIGEGAFENCTELKEITLNIGLEQIKDRAFLHCNAELVHVPSTVGSVGIRAFEGMDVDYGTNQPATTYETSATRLSNESYRAPEPDADAVASGIVLEEPDGASAVLDGAVRSYVMQLSKSQDTAVMEKAFSRAFGIQVPEGAYVFDMQMYDNSGIPLVKLGRQILTVILPLPDSLKGQELRLFGLDRNGQLEERPVELVAVEGKECVRFSTNCLSQMSLCPTGAAAGEVIEISVETESFSAPPEESGMSVGVILKFCLSGAVLFTGIMLFIAGLHRRRIQV